MIRSKFALRFVLESNLVDLVDRSQNFETHLLLHCNQYPIEKLGAAITGCMSPEKKKTRRDILLAILKEFRFIIRFLRSRSGDETTSMRAILQGLRDNLRF